MLNSNLRMEKGYDISSSSLAINSNMFERKNFSIQYIVFEWKKYAYDRPNIKNLIVEAFVAVSIDI